MNDPEPRLPRLDQQVVAQLPNLSRASAAKLVEAGHVQVNGQVEQKAGHKVRPDDVITITYDEKLATHVPEIELPVIYEDKHCVVINKPAGLLSHSKGAFNPEATVATWLANRTTGLAGERAGIVHRLDRGTSGVMICAKTPEALGWLQKQFSQRKVKKSYIAVSKGELAKPEAVIDMPIERNPKRPQTFRVGVNGKAAVTEYHVLKTGNGRSLIELKPLTGRTHQLRVHLSQLGAPIIGDTLYGGEPAERLFLHAQSLELTLPNKQCQTFTVPAPNSFSEAVVEG